MLDVIVAALIGSVAPLPSVDELVARHHRAIGVISSTTAHWTGSIKRGQSTDRFEMTADYTGRYRQSWTTPLGTTIEGSDGSTDWAQDENGDVVQRPTEHGFSFEYALLRLNDFRIESDTKASVEGPVSINGRQAFALKLVQDGHSTTLYLDVKTYLVDGADAGDRIVRYRRYQSFDGVPIPMMIEESQTGAAGDDTVTRTIDTVAFGVPVEGKFGIPIPREPAFPSGINEIVTSFDDALHGLIVLDAAIDGKPVRMLLDSGSSSSIIDIDAAKRLNLPTSGVAQVQGVRLLSGTYARAENLDVKGIEFAPFIMEAIPLKLPPALTNKNIDGVLGYDLLSHVVARMAYGIHELRLTKPSTFTYAGTGVIVPADLSTRVPYIGATLGYKDQGTFTIDTGSDEALVLYGDYARAHQRDFDDPSKLSPQTSSAVGGDIATEAGLVTYFNIGHFSVPSVPTEVVIHASGAFTAGRSDGLIGAQLLRRFRAVFLDYHNNRVIFEQ